MREETVRLDYTPRVWQKECHALKRKFRFLVLAVHRQAGKTRMTIMELLHAAMKCQHDRGSFAYLGPKLNQTRDVAWNHLKLAVRPLELAGAVEIREFDLSIRFVHNNAKVRLVGGNHPDSLRGITLDGLVVDEVAEIKPELWESILRPTLAARLGWAIFIGTPHGINLFSQLFYRAQAGEDPEWGCATYTVYETHALSASEIESSKRDQSEKSFAREFLCDFSAAGDDQLISFVDVEEASRRILQPADIREAPVILGVDPARFGDDRSVIFRRQGLQAFPPKVYRGIDNMDLASRVAAEITEHSPEAVFIDSGAGSGVIDRLRQLNYNVIEVPFGGKAVDAGLYVNRRTEMWCEMATWIRSGAAIPNDNTLKQELATPIYWFDPQGRKVLESKDDIKERLQGGASPDLADALALTFASPVAKQPEIERYRQPKKPKDYDPYRDIR